MMDWWYFMSVGSKGLNYSSTLLRNRRLWPYFTLCQTLNCWNYADCIDLLGCQTGDVCEAAVFYNLYLLCSSVHIFSTVFHYQPTGFADDELQRWLLFHPGTKISISHYILYDWTVLNVTCNLTVEAYSTTGRRMFCFADNKKSTGNLDWWNCRVMQTP